MGRTLEGNPFGALAFSRLLRKEMIWRDNEPNIRQFRSEGSTTESQERWMNAKGRNAGESHEVSGECCNQTVGFWRGSPDRRDLINAKCFLMAAGE